MKNYVYFKGSNNYYDSFRSKDFKVKISDYCVIDFPFYAIAKNDNGEKIFVKAIGYYSSGRVYKNKLITTKYSFYKNSAFYCECYNEKMAKDHCLHRDEKKVKISVYGCDIINFNDCYKNANKNDILEHFKSYEEIIKE